MKAIWRGQVIAESDRTLDVGGYTYFPRETVRMDLLSAAPKSDERSEVPARRPVLRRQAAMPRAARVPRGPTRLRCPKMSQVDHWIGFWEDVEVE